MGRTTPAKGGKGGGGAPSYAQETLSEARTNEASQEWCFVPLEQLFGTQLSPLLRAAAATCGADPTTLGVPVLVATSAFAGPYAIIRVRSQEHGKHLWGHSCTPASHGPGQPLVKPS